MPYTEIAFSSFTAYVLAVMALQQAGFLHTNEWHGGAIPKGVKAFSTVFAGQSRMTIVVSTADGDEARLLTASSTAAMKKATQK